MKGNNLLVVKVFDEGCKEEVIKSLQRSEFDVEVGLSEKDIRVKLGKTKKEQIDEALKSMNKAYLTFKNDLSQVRN